MAKSELNWFPVDTDTMPASVKEAWNKLQKANEAAKQAKETFETLFVREARKAERIEDDYSLAFGYRFGKLAIAKVDKTEEKAKAKPKNAFTF